MRVGTPEGELMTKSIHRRFAMCVKNMLDGSVPQGKMACQASMTPLG